MFSFNDLINEKKRPLVMGILNVTPDSFSDGGEAFNLNDALKKVEILQKEGADIIDIGACSTAPMNETVSEEEEVKRLKTFLREIIKNSSVPVSIDTFRPKAAEMALSMGATIINDESGCFKEDMARLVKEYSCGWVFMHTGESDSKNQVKYSDGVIKNVLEFFSNMKAYAVNFGISEAQLSYDPGIGFGKTRQNDLEIVKGTDLLSNSFSPILIGASRKRLIGELTGEASAKDRVSGSVAAAVLASYKGAGIIRVHDVKETLDAIKVTEAVKRGVL